MLKTASAGFPKTFLHNDAWKKEHEDDPEPKRGDTRHVTAEIEVSGSKRNVYGHAWNEPGTAGLPKKVLVSSCGDTLPTDPHIKKRFKVSETDARYGEVIERYVPRVSIVKQYFNAACQIDVHNHLRQGVIGIEDHVGTNCHIFRLFCTIFSMSMVDAYKMYYKLRTNDDEEGVRKFVSQLAAVFLTNREPGCAALQPEVRSLRARAMGVEVPQNEPRPISEVHCLVPVSAFKATYMNDAMDMPENHQKHGTKVRCKVCTPQNGERLTTGYCCLACSIKEKKPWGMCGPKLGSTCAHDHAIAMSIL
jgi:hypothetical protein